ncbi:MAG: Zn-ribbon domain-containing protein [Methanosarcinales archaeon]|nr:Zn-ribbon domain-containing protein [Methanosarcinales archaeon]
MPHRCTKCGAVFEDGDSVILTGCPECKWNKFFYVRAEEVNANPEKGSECQQPAVNAADAANWDIEERVAEKQDKSIDGMLEDIDRALDSDDVNKKELDTDRVDSIRILDTGSYELNLGSIMKKEEIVVGIKEEGQYAIDLPMMLQKSGKTSKKKKK